MSEYEYGIARSGDDPHDAHRSGMTEQEAREWVRECEEEMGFTPGVFRVIRRFVGQWETA